LRIVGVDRRFSSCGSGDAGPVFDRRVYNDSSGFVDLKESEPAAISRSIFRSPPSGTSSIDERRMIATGE
jgi:hypothetical protein